MAASLSTSTTSSRQLRVGLRTRLAEEISDPPVTASSDRVLQGLLWVLLVFAALAFGATEAWSQEILAVLSFLIMAAVGAKLIVNAEARFRWSWSYVLVFAFLVIIALQLWPLPSNWVASISPATARLRERTLGEHERLMPVSLYPTATASQLRLIIVVVAVFVATLHAHQTSADVVRTMAAVVIGATLVLALAIYQNLSGSRMIYGLVPAIHANSGPFMNYGHYAQYMNISLGLAMGLLLLQLQNSLGDGELTWRRFRRAFKGSESWKLWSLTIGIVLAAISVLLCMSRGGIISLVVASSGSLALAAFRSRLRGKLSIIVILTLTVFAVLLYAGFDRVYDRLATLRNIQRASNGRWEILRDLRQAFVQFPTLGTGLGTHEFVFPMFDRSTIMGTATHAENEYAQLMEETGAAGMVCILGFLATIVIVALRMAWRQRSASHVIVYGLLLSIGAAAVQSFTDFGQHVPAIACLMAVVCGLVLVTARHGSETVHGQLVAKVGGRVGRWIAGGSMLTGSIVGGLILIFQIDTARAAQLHADSASAAESYLASHNLVPEKRDIVRNQLLTEASAAAALEPHNVSFSFLLARARWSDIAIRATDPQQPGRIVLSAPLLTELRSTVQLLRGAMHDCPAYGTLYCFTGQIEKFVLSDPRGDRDIQLGYELCRTDADSCLIAGRLEATSGNWDLALERFRRAVELNPGCRVNVIDQLVSQFHRIDLAIPFAGDDTQAAAYLARALANDPTYGELAAKYQQLSREQVLSQANRDDASAEELVRAADQFAADKDFDSAIRMYRRALRKDYSAVEWHVQVGNLLLQQNHRSEAVEEARIALSLRPQWQPAVDLRTAATSRSGDGIAH